MAKKTTTKAKAPKTTKPAKASAAPAVEAQVEPQAVEAKKNTTKAKAPKSTKAAKAIAAPAVESQAEPQATETKATKAPKAKKEAKEKKVSALDAAAQVLAGSKEPMNAKQMIEVMAAKGLWTSPGGATPHATLYSAILREIQVRGKDARFVKTDRGLFAANG